jgi:pimeloyl-ACP methyl ester carboxylesterase
MAVFVLVHGMMHGGWCWRYVRDTLQQEGHIVFTPTLTGLGERAHLASPDIELSTHVTDIVNVIDYEDLSDVVLVGHSYAGLVIPSVANKIPERIRMLIYLDALTVEHGKSAMEIYGSSDRGKDLSRRASEDKNRYCRWEEEDLMRWGIAGHDDEEWVRRHLTAHPFKTMEGTVEFDNPDAHIIPAAYIKCGAVTADAQNRMLKNRGWRLLGLDAGHDAMITAPTALTDMLLEILD